MATMTFHFADNQPDLGIEAPEDDEGIKEIHDRIVFIVNERRKGGFRFASLQDVSGMWVAFDPTHINRITSRGAEGAPLGFGK